MQGGVLLGPTFLRDTYFYMNYIVPFKVVTVIETFANLALVYYMFLVGMEVSIDPIVKSGRKALSIALAGILIPIFVGRWLFTLVTPSAEGFMYWSIGLGATNFPEVSMVLADLKLLRTEMGQLAMSSAVITDFCTWFFLVFTLSVTHPHTASALMPTVAFVLVCIYVLRPFIAWVMRKTVKRDQLTEDHIWTIMAAVLFFGLITDTCGVHSITGSFMFGAIMPRKRSLRVKLMEKLDGVVSDVLMPVFFLVSGIRTDFTRMFRAFSLEAVVPIVVVSFSVKIVTTLFVSSIYKINLEDAKALAVLMNVKGVLPLIILHVGRNQEALSDATFSLMVLCFLFMTCLAEPIIALTYTPRKKIVKHTIKSVHDVCSIEAHFKILACVHGMSDAPSMISLLEASNATKESPVIVVGAHLVELKGRATATMIMNDQYRTTNQLGISRTEPELLVDAFDSYGKRNSRVKVENITVAASYSSIHEDVCSLAADKRCALIILPFHIEGPLRGSADKHGFISSDLTKSVLEKAPCSVALLIDRGKKLQCQRIAMLFIGGPDDREALAYASRMAANGSVSLTVVRLQAGRDAGESSSQSHPTSNDAEFVQLSSQDAQQRLDDEDIYGFKFRTAENEAVTYTERVVRNGEETVAVIREIEANCDLYIVGKGKAGKPPFSSGLSDVTTCPQLGLLGNILLSCHVGSQASVLLLQQYNRRNAAANRNETSSSWSPLLPQMGHEMRSFGHMSIGSEEEESQ
ncbi:hypothetical protein Tsubulata_012083 [Turnera subulata]|uniref:Cation/H+ exchanger domain-containing protein n=1 Tax=Turnera subulata TaxID=218843 RepID=A0A9Q0F334_9ROSI|nr:hypothetical protein Tsubulata_012083 [Turnera subulata]